MSRSQVVRVETERWMAANGYCLACASDRLLPTQANTPARDFECDRCAHPYELKAAARPFGPRAVGGAYATMIHRIHHGTAPSFLLLRYAPGWHVTDLLAVPRSLVTAEVIQRRNALSPTARRAGWVGCNILLGHIPPEGRIAVIHAGVPEDIPTLVGCQRLFHAAEAGRTISDQANAARYISSLFFLCLRARRMSLCLISIRKTIHPKTCASL